MTDRYAVFGNPIEHSRSPDIHGHFARQTGQDMVYDKESVPVDGFVSRVDTFFSAEGKGLNITLPFKEEAYRYASELTDRARRAGAVNTLASLDGHVLGDNTDGAGLVRDLTVNLGWSLAGKRVLILGAGGAVRGALQPLLAGRPIRLVIANRTVAKAEALARDFEDLGPVEGMGFDGLPGLQFDLVINGTSASLAGDLPPLPDDLLAADAVAYDMMYAPEPTVFMVWARDHGAASVSDGLGMLVEQAAESFHLWRGVRPETAAVMAQVRARLKAAK